MVEKINRKEILSGRLYCQDGLVKEGVIPAQVLKAQREGWSLDGLLECKDKLVVSTCPVVEYLEEPPYKNGRWYYQGQLTLPEVTFKQLLEAEKRGIIEELLVDGVEVQGLHR